MNVAHTISSTSTANLNSDPCVKMLLKGAKNIEGMTRKKKISRLPMNIDLLSILGHRLSQLNNLNWNSVSKQVFWTACVTSFFTSCRMGEILPNGEKEFDPHTTLLWQNISFGDNKEILIFVPYSKTTGFDGKLLDVYPIEGSNLCPASALIRLRKLAKKEGLFGPQNPVFSFKSKKNLTKAILNENWGNFWAIFVTKTTR